MEKKITYIDALSLAISVLSENGYDAEVITKLEQLKASTKKRNASKSKKEIAKQDVNASLADVILEVLATCPDPVTITEMMALDERFDGLKVQKISPIMRKLMESGKVNRTEEKHKAYFSLAVEG